MALKVFFLVVFVSGLALAVYSMLHGVERSNRRANAKPSPIFNAPAVSAFAIFFGAIAYLLFTKTRIELFTILIVGIVVGSVATAGVIAVLARWALPYSGRATEDDTTQGVLALVTRTITPSHPGEIAFVKDGVRQTIAANSLQGSEIPQDTEVVIDSILHGIAQVEPWSSVEQRL
jgi:hypothetical protein